MTYVSTRKYIKPWLDFRRIMHHDAIRHTFVANVRWTARYHDYLLETAREAPRTLPKMRPKLKAQWMWQQRHSLSVWIWSWDCTNLCLDSNVRVLPHSNRSFNKNFSILWDFSSPNGPQQIRQVIWLSPCIRLHFTRWLGDPPVRMNDVKIFKGWPPDMPLRNMYNCGTKHFRMTSMVI